MASKYSVETIFKGVDKMTAPISKMRKKISKFTRSIERGFKRANKFMSKLSEKMKAGFAKGAIILGSAITAVGIAIKKVADRADELSKTAKILNMPIEELQEWQFVAEQSGLTSESLTKSLGVLSKQIGQAKTGTGTLVTILKKSNPQLLKQLITAKDTSKAFNIIIQALRKIKDPAKRSALAFAAFGRQGLKIITIAQTSAKKISILREEARKNGLITQKQAAAAEAFNDQLNSLQKTFQGIIQSVLLPIMPLLKEYLKNIQDWTMAHRDLIKQNVKKFIMGIGEAIKFLVKHGKLILEVAASLYVLIKALKAFEGVMIVVNALMDANPIGIILVGIGLLTAAVIWITTHWDKFKEAIKASLKPLKTLYHMMLKVRDVFTGKIAFTPQQNVAAFAQASQADPFNFRNTVGSAFTPQVISPQERVAKSITEKTTTNKAQVTIVDKTNTGAVTSGELPQGILLEKSGDF